MYKLAMKEKMSVKGIFDIIKYKIQFRKDHPYFFDPCGTLIFCGSQGTGKTLSATNYVYNVCRYYPLSILCTNVALKDYPFNTGYKVDDKGFVSLYWLATGELVTTDKILDGTFEQVCVEYDGLDCLKYISNGEYGVTYYVDELHLELNSLESRNIPIEVITEISQQRKQRKHIVGTSQIFMRLAKPVREQIKNIVLCRIFFGCIQYNKIIDGETCTEENGKLIATVKGRFLYTHNSDMYQRYDTFAKMKRYNKEWNGVSRSELYRKEALIDGKRV